MGLWAVCVTYYLLLVGACLLLSRRYAARRCPQGYCTMTAPPTVPQPYWGRPSIDAAYLFNDQASHRLFAKRATRAAVATGNPLPERQLAQKLDALMQDAKFRILRPSRPIILGGLCFSESPGGAVVLGLETWLFRSKFLTALLAPGAVRHELVHAVQHICRRALDEEWRWDTPGRFLAASPKWIYWELHAWILALRFSCRCSWFLFSARPCCPICCFIPVSARSHLRQRQVGEERAKMRLFALAIRITAFVLFAGAVLAVAFVTRGLLVRVIGPLHAAGLATQAFLGIFCLIVAGLVTALAFMAVTYTVGLIASRVARGPDPAVLTTAATTVHSLRIVAAVPSPQAVFTLMYRMRSSPPSIRGNMIPYCEQMVENAKERKLPDSEEYADALRRGRRALGTD